MKSNFRQYDYKLGIERMKEILSSSDSEFEEKDSIPSSDSLTFTNGYYVSCTAVACDIRESSELAKKYNRPKLSKLLKAYISELVAVLNSSANCKEVLIEGDCVWAIYDTPYQTDIDVVFEVMFKANSVVNFLNHFLKKNSFETIRVGIGASYGRSLMIKAGYKSSGINELVWLGHVVNEAHHFCSLGAKFDNWKYNDQIVVANTIYNNLNEYNQKLLTKNYSHDCYFGNVVHKEMNSHLLTLT